MAKALHLLTIFAFFCLAAWAPALAYDEALIRGLEKDAGGHCCVVLDGVDIRLEVSRRQLPEVRKRIKKGLV